LKDVFHCGVWYDSFDCILRWRHMSDHTKVEARLVSIQVGKPRTVTDTGSGRSTDQSWTTGFFKDAVSGLVLLERTNLAGDGQADLDNHGGPEKAVNVYPVEHYPYWERTVGFTHLQPGAFGENFTTEGLLEADVCIGDVFEVGDALVQISQPRQPCWKLARRWDMKDLALRVQETGRTGWYFRVLREGHLQAGNTLVLIERPSPNWTVAAANEVMHHRLDHRQAALDLANCIHLSPRWRTKLERRARTGTIESSVARLDGSAVDREK
jgi:MOSC domain-containing protein YiiM